MKNTAEAKAPAQGFDDHRMEAIMGRLLQLGVLLASGCVLVGGILYLRAHGGAVRSYHVFTSEPVELRHLTRLLKGIGAGQPEAIIQLGVLLLIATPVARVVFAGFAFALERDRLYVAISGVILAVLVIGLLFSN